MYCSSFHYGRCWETKEREPCFCNGDEDCCTFYPEKKFKVYKEESINSKNQSIHEITLTEKKTFERGRYEGVLKCIAEIQKILPQEVWSQACNQVLSEGNAGVWTMCLVAVEELADFWRSEH